MYTPGPDFTIAALLTNDTGVNNMSTNYQLNSAPVGLVKGFLQFQKTGIAMLSALVFALMASVSFAGTGSMSADYQLHRVSVDVAHGYRQIIKAEKALTKGDANKAARQFDKALDNFNTAEDHAAKADNDILNKAAKVIDSGNKELQKAIDAYSDGKTDSGDTHYANAMTDYDKALDMLD
jgi:hypothetical protein